MFAGVFDIWCRYVCVGVLSGSVLVEGCFSRVLNMCESC